MGRQHQRSPYGLAGTGAGAHRTRQCAHPASAPEANTTSGREWQRDGAGRDQRPLHQAGVTPKTGPTTASRRRTRTWEGRGCWVWPEQ
eukprot:15435966-Alexandrium_andersonii.AAC.1